VKIFVYVLILKFRIVILRIYLTTVRNFAENWKYFDRR